MNSQSVVPVLLPVSELLPLDRGAFDRLPRQSSELVAFPPHIFVNTELVENFEGVGRQHDGSTYVQWLGSGFEDGHRDAVLMQSKRERKTSETTADDCDPLDWY